jgi:N-acetylglucosaminyldiphosphoundecaprenol N-acetyl-beta-D-mannosaminyltransferase
VSPRDDAPVAVLGGTHVDLLDRDAVLERLRLSLDTRSPVAVGSVNLDHIYHFGARGASRDVLERGRIPWLMLLDGSPPALSVRLLSRVTWPRIAGSDLIGPVVDLAADRGDRIGFVGGTAEMHETLRERLAVTHPTLEVSGCWAPERAELADPVRAGALADEVRRADTDVVVVGLGKPRQELWIERHGLRSGASVLLAFGASADFLAGVVPRAPELIRRFGMEWGYRLAHEPRRLSRRYALEGPTAALVMARNSFLAPRW